MNNNVDIIKVCADNKACNIFLHDFCKTNEEMIESVRRRPPHEVKFTDGSVLLVMPNSTYERWCKGRTCRILGHGKQLYHSGYLVSGGNDDSEER